MPGRRTFVYDGQHFVVDRGVFDPVRHLSGIAFADHLADALDALDATGSTRGSVLDVGTGCGILAFVAGSTGRSAMAVDVNERAVACAQRNLAATAIEIRRSDLFESVGPDRFDTVIANPPYEMRRTWRRGHAAFRSPDFLERFGQQLPRHSSVAIVGFPADNADALRLTGLRFSLWKRVPTAGHDLGIFISDQRS